MIKKLKLNNILRNLWLFALLFAASIADARTVEEALETFLSSPSLDRSQTGLFIWDLEADYRVAAHQAELPVTPASVMKCVTAAALSSRLPYSTSLITNVCTEGSIRNGVLQGNLVVVGCGDPSLGDGRHKGQPDFPKEIAEALKAKGISAFKGKVVIDDSRFEGPATHPTWGTTDLGAYYGTGVHAFNYEGNASGKAAVKDPGAVFKRKLEDAFRAAGIQHTDTVLDVGNAKRKVLLSHSSPPLANLMQSCIFRSDNMYAEAFLRLFGVKSGTDGSATASAKEAMRFWDAQGFNLDGVEIVDGSGLSRSNRLTALFLGEMLISKSKDPDFVSFFPLVGEEGTVKGFLSGTSLQGYLALKTGSMNGIQSYAGYLLDEDFVPTHVVVVMTNGLKNRANYRAALANFFLSIFR